jgi:hypothetical protein
MNTEHLRRRLARRIYLIDAACELGEYELARVHLAKIGGDWAAFRAAHTAARS